MGNQTVVLGAEAHFSCLLVGREENLRLRIDGRLTALPFFTPNLDIRVERSQRVDGLTISNVSIDITATRERNMTRIECYDVTMDSAAFSVALLTVRGMWYIACMCRYSAGFFAISILQEDQGNWR